MNVLITDSAELKRLNSAFRKKSEATDVLSFPSEHAGLVGEIAISSDIAKRNADALGHSAAEEIKILTLHGMLHLAGYDHEIDRGKMAKKEEKLRKELALPVGLIRRNRAGTVLNPILRSFEFRSSEVESSELGSSGCRSMTIGVAITLLLLVGLLIIVSYVDRVYSEIGKFLSRDFQDNIDVFEQEIEPKLGLTRSRAALSMAVLAQLITAAISMFVAYAVFRDRDWGVEEVLQATLALILIVIICNRFLPFVFFSRTKGRWLLRWTLLLKVLIYVALPATLVLGFLRSVATLTREHSEKAVDSQAEAVDALIEAGQEEGILNEGNRDLIQSVVEFSEKTVREAMKPRPEIVAVPIETTVEQFIDLLRTKPFSRVPVFEGTIHNIKGIVYAQDVLQVPDTEARTRRVDSVMRRDVYFVPESKLGRDLLREMQKGNIRMAVVVDEYGGVAGVVTIEDLVEEIVGEIRDDHDKAEVTRESDHSYIVRGNMDVDRLGELFGVRAEGKESSTVAGLVSELAGRIPQNGEIVEDGGLRFEVLESTGRRVERVRISASPVKLA